jgi:predicted amidohydrolase
MAHVDATGAGRNSAVVIDADGEVVGRQHKLQLVPTDHGWRYAVQPGRELNVFNIAGVPSAIIVCHDKRYPELVRLPVLAGARMIYYLSAEAWHDDRPLPAPRTPPWDADRLERELQVYRAQVQARAVENRVWVVKSNVAGCREDVEEGSHGQSCVVDPTGIVRVEASVYEEELLTWKADLSEACALYARKSLMEEYALSEWWADGVKRVRVHS